MCIIATTKMKCCPLHSWWILIMVVIVMFPPTAGGCREEERRALLDIKFSLINTYDLKPEDLLPSWMDYGNTLVGDASGSGCCDWERVKCNTTTHHVTHISLGTLNGRSYVDKKFWPLNVSLFLHFKELRSLNLSRNFLDGGVMNTELERLSSLKKLELLDLSRNFDIDNGIIPSLGALTSLKILDLSYTKLGGYFPANGKICSFRKPGNVGSNKLPLYWNIPNRCLIASLSVLPSLKALDLQGNRRFRSFRAQALENLEVLDLTRCGIDTFEIHGFEKVSILRKLEILYLRDNRFSDSIIASLSVLPSLKTLDLQANWISRSFPAQELAHLTNLEELHLSDTSLHGTPNIQACRSLSRLKRLKSIDLSYNNFNKSIISCLSALPSLKILDLSHSFSWGSSFPSEDFHNLPDLEVLLLRKNGFNGTIPMEAFSSFNHLEVLDLSYNHFVGSIPSTIHTLSSLKAVSFAYNDLNGSLVDHGFCGLKNLMELDLSYNKHLSYNKLNGILPRCFNSLSSLKMLDVSSNQFTGILVPSLIANLTSLEYIDFSHNKFDGSFSFSSFSNHPKLEVVRFGSDNDKFEVETEEPIGWIPMFQLKFLELSNCNINRRKGHMVPMFLLHQHKLQVVDMSHNSLRGLFPNWLIKNNTNLEALNLRNNSFGGIISISSYRNTNMQELDVSGNHMIGTIPNDIQKFAPYIVRLNLSMNALSGAIPSSVGDLNELSLLDLSDNELSGEVPKGLFTNMSSLMILKLSNNKLYGEVLSGNLSLLNINRVHLDNKYFTGKIGKEIPEYLTALDISNNFFTGMIPGWISNMSDLSELLMRNNSFEGRFPCGIAQFSFLDISQNSFSGPIPSCLNLQVMEHLHLGSNRFTGWIPDHFRNLTKVLTLDIGNNNLSGMIPEFLGELSTLRILLLRKNNFSGFIPKQLCQLSNVSLIDLSHNSLSGSIPSCLQNITGPSDLAFIETSVSLYHMFSSYEYVSAIRRSYNIYFHIEELETQDEVQFTTKKLFLHYKGDIRDYMTGLDQSSNKLTGEIPQELGLLSQIRALNLSHNHLTGPIPVNFSNLAKIESLDLSSNSLTGKVPSELIKLTSLSTFNVSHNNLSGRLPEMKTQFATFTEASYEGNPLLCGLPLEKKCSTDSQVTNSSAEEDNEKWYAIDMTWFYVSFGSTWGVLLLGFVALLYINPYWCRRQTKGDCIEEERKALLEIKASHMKSYDSEMDNFLPTWVDYDNSTPGDGGGDCCDWERVTCNTTTAHVTELSLYYLRGTDDNIKFWSKFWPLNISLFLHFKELRSLNLSDDFLDKEIMKIGLEKLSSLKKLEELDLSFNYDIDNDILPSLMTLTSLKILDLSFTSLNGNC
ncbi:unnamed protein product [Lactuca saligna]|uniref:Leucine-rich repeat-containing N-terminal plant-type domain-containing protein n=1 Tax=Lactuca saligna TaxID=75948 RepID=A0AA35YAW4_LACSI|nr:unnamed protein product [Lactuca saligna]